MTIFALTGDTGFAWQRYGLKARFTNVAGLKPGSPVRIAGIEVGTVDDTVLAGEQVEVIFQVHERHRGQITTGSVATLGSVSLLGESAVDITPSAQGTPVPEWGYVPSGRPAAQISDLTAQAGDGIQELTAVLQDVRRGRGTVGKLMTDERLYTELHRFVSSASELTEGIRQGRGSIGKLLNDPATANSLEASLKNLEDLTRQINAGEGSLGRLLKDDSFANALTSATSSFNELAARVNRGEGTAGKLVTDPTLFNRLNSVTERLDLLVNRLNEGEGTMGQLLKDRQLYENMNQMTSELRTLIARITKDPKRYLNLKISIF
jgi:phospholipid/cholesterol/gamma-HCH transport system substrate-binding protein